MIDARMHAESVLRNRAPILAVLRPVLAGLGSVLEVASGTGGHVAYFASALPHVTFQPSDPSPEARASIDAWVAAEGLGNVRPALALDAASSSWPVPPTEAVVCINMVHISPWAATLGLLQGAAALLGAGGVLYLYGPYLRAGIDTAGGNLAFDASLRARDPAWGLRRLEDVADAARAVGFSAPSIHEMPANNLSVLFTRAS